MRALPVLLVSIFALACAGETSKPEAKAPKSAAAKSAAAAQAAPASKAATAEPQYTVRIIPGDATAGAEAKSVVEVTPKPGYKMNKDFPAQMKQIKGPDGVTLAKDTLSVGDAELSEKMLRFTVPFTAAKAGQVDLAGLCDFSVCNERACKLIRDEKVAWQVAVK